MQPFPKWVSWIFVGLLAYIIYTGNQSDRPPASTPQEPVTTTSDTPKEYESLRQLTDGDRWFRAINPNYVGDADIKEITLGEGEAVSCGNEVELFLRGTTQEGANFDATHDESKPLKFRVGDAPFAALNEGVIGMKQHGVRLLNAPANHVYGDPKKRTLNEIKFHLTLQKHVAPKNENISAMSVTLAAGKTKGEPARCGAPITANIEVFNVEGVRIYKTASPVTFTLGKGELAQGVDMLARGMLPDEQRLLYVPPQALIQNAKADAVLAPLRQSLRSKHLLVVHITRVE
jgi:FKBP-type peptidyl-prolyl cis-trans isomerase 2